MTAWTEIEIACSAEDAVEIVLAYASNDGVRSGRDDPRIGIAVDCADFEARPGRWLDIAPSRAGERRILLIGAPSGETSSAHDWASLGGHIVEAMSALRIEAACAPRAAAIGHIALGASLHSFRSDLRGNTAGRRLRLLVDPEDEPAARNSARVAHVVNRARAWVQAPPNRLTPQTWAAALPPIFEPLGAQIRIVDKEGLEALGAGALLAVGGGAEHGPLLALVEWRGAPERHGWDAVVVGKGITFDSGGLNLKSSPNLGLMRFDMAGGAAVLGAVELAATRKARCNVVAIVPMAENAVDACSYRPGDVITSMAGITIEVRNTDFEGRLVLADAITYARQTYNPGHIVDLATLTGMIAITLLEEYAGLYSNDDTLATALEAAGRDVGELAWRMPCRANQDYVVESLVADVANQSTFAGAMGIGTSAPVSGPKLLEKFVGETAWAHLDIAGVAWATRRSPYYTKDATGYGVRLLDRWFRDFERDVSPPAPAIVPEESDDRR